MTSYNRRIEFVSLADRSYNFSNCNWAVGFQLEKVLGSQQRPLHPAQDFCILYNPRLIFYKIREKFCPSNLSFCICFKILYRITRSKIAKTRAFFNKKKLLKLPFYSSRKMRSSYFLSQESFPARERGKRYFESQAKRDVGVAFLTHLNEYQLKHQ